MVACFRVCVIEQHDSCSFNSTVIYLEGNLETKIFTDPVTGLVRRIREVAIRRNGTNGKNSISLLRFSIAYIFHWETIKS